jgi:HPt (histidine-containing phosphotransfer) domain-containing protein
MAVTQPSTDSKQAAAVQAAFEQLRQQFLQGLTGRWRDINEASTPGDRKAALHRLIGAAGSYGYAEISERAREAEHLLEAPTIDAAALQQALDALRCELLSQGVTL